MSYSVERLVFKGYPCPPLGYVLVNNTSNVLAKLRVFDTEEEALAAGTS